jgi:endonuclease/exonuclease/phosphatase (EEP) superfamily protein YafD
MVQTRPSISMAGGPPSPAIAYTAHATGMAASTSTSIHSDKAAPAPPSNAGQLRLLTWNVHSLRGTKLLVLGDLLRANGIDVAIITETELNADDHPVISGYEVFFPAIERSSRVRVVLLAKPSLNPSAIDLYNSADLPIVAVKIGSLIVAGIYRQFSLPGTEEKGHSFEVSQLAKMSDLLADLSLKGQICLAGDLNLDIPRLHDPSYYRSCLLQDWLATVGDRLGLKWLHTEPTFKSDGLFSGSHRTATLDHIYIPADTDAQVSLLPDAMSDHSPVLATIPIRCTSHSKAVSNCKTRRERDFQNLNVDVLNVCLLDWDWQPLLTETANVDRAVELLEDALGAALDVAAPLKTFHSPNSQVRLSGDTRKVMQARDKAKREGKKHYAQLRNRALSLVRRDHIKCGLARIKKGGQSAAWAIVSEAQGGAKKAPLPLPPNCSTFLEASNHCNEFYIKKIVKLREGLCKLPPNSEEPNLLSAPKLSFQGVGTAAVRRALQNLKTTSACGIDDIPISVYKKAWSSLALPLTHLANLILSSSSWPTRWKTATVVPVLKVGKPRQEVSSYRPVSLLCAVSKLMERIISDQLVALASKVGHIPDEQHGFRPKHSVDTALATTLSHVSAFQSQGKKATLAAYDFSAAFDTVDPQVLLKKLHWLSSSSRLLLNNYLSGRSQRVLWNGVKSNLLPVSFGVPQGSVLGPLLFILLTADLPLHLQQPSTAITLYADDTSCLVGGNAWESNNSVLDSTTGCLTKYSSKVGLCLNASKTQFLQFVPSSEATLTLLGVTLDGGLHFTEHHSKVLKDIRQRICAIRRLETKISRGSLLTAAAKALVIGRLQCSSWITRKARISPGPSSVIDLKIQVAINDLARVLLGAHRIQHTKVEDLINRSSLPTLNEITVKQSAIAAWTAMRDSSPLSFLLQPVQSQTRAASKGLVRPLTDSIAAVNMAEVWNSCPDLRKAVSLHSARQCAIKLARCARFY